MRISLFLLFSAIAVQAADVAPATLKAAAQKGLTLLEQTSPTFVKKGGCNSCHNQMLPAAAQAFARKQGIHTGPTIEQLPPEVSEVTTERFIEYSTNPVNSAGYELFAYASAGRPADARIDSMTYYIKSMQQPDGYWRTTGNRPPLSFDDFTTTAYAIYALKSYTSEAQRADTETRLARARSWLLEAKPETTQERSFHLLGMAWSKSSREALDKAAQGLRAMQQTNGGWSQLGAMSTDAYATGMALYALHEGGVTASDAAYQKGLRYLLSTQAPDGTWHVKSRSLTVQPYFESGYPYGHDQWISAAGAAYATMAIAAAVEPERRAQK